MSVLINSVQVLSVGQGMEQYHKCVPFDIITQ